MDFNKTVKKAYKRIMAKYPDAIFYEAQGVLKEENGEVVPDAEQVTCVFQAEPNKVVYLIYQEGKRSTIKKFDGYFVQDCAIGPKCKVSLEKAFDIMHSADIILPHSLYVTLRRPLTKDVKEYPDYIYGDNHNNPYVFVNSFTGAVDYQNI